MTTKKHGPDKPPPKPATKPQRAPAKSGDPVRQMIDRFGNRAAGGAVAARAQTQHSRDAIEAALHSAAQPLRTVVSPTLASRLPHDAGSVRAHAGPESAHAAAQLGARAFTAGGEIHFGPEVLSPRTSDREQIVAHEVAHALQHRGSSAVDPGRISDKHGPAERQADAFARSVARDNRPRKRPPLTPARDGRLHRVPAPPAKLPCEDDIRDWLDWQIGPQNEAKAFERVRRLAMIFRSLVSPYREQLHARLVANARTDALAQLFHLRLSTKSRKDLIAKLEGAPRPLAQLDPSSMPAFVEGLAAQSIAAEPEAVPEPGNVRVGEEVPIVVDSVEVPTAMVHLSIRSAVSPLGTQDVPLMWTVRTFECTETYRHAGRWPAGTPTSAPVRVPFEQAGSYLVDVDITDNEGLLLTSVSRTVEVHESELDRLRALDDDALKWKWAELRDAIFNGKPPDDLDGQQLREQLDRVEWVAAERKLDVREHVDQDVSVIKDTTLPLITLQNGLVLAGSPQKIRYQLEDAIIEHGTTEVGRWVIQAVNRIEPLEAASHAEGTRSDERTELEFASRRCHWALQQYRAIQAEDEELIGQFEAAMWGQLEKTLEMSAAGAESARRQYGIPSAGGEYSADDQARQEKARKELSVVANELAAAKEPAEWSYEETLASLYNVEGPDGPEIWEQQAQFDVQVMKNPPADGYGAPGTPEWAEIVRRATTYLAAKERQKTQETVRKQYAALFAKRLQHYPVLAAYRDAPSYELRNLANEGSIVDELAAKCAEVDKNIAKVRKHLAKRSNHIWQLDNLVQTTMSDLHIAPGTLHAVFVQEKVQNAESWWETALTWIGIGLAIAAAPFTGGSSIAVALELAGLMVTGLQLSEDIQKYQFGMAAAHSDLDRLRALASEEPSLGAIFLDLVFAGLQVASVIKAARAAIKLRRAIALGRIETPEVKALVDELNNVGKNTLDRNLGDEIADEALRATKAEPYEQELARMLEGTPAATLDVKVRPLDDAAFKAATGSESGQAAVVFKRNPSTGKLEPELLLREGADPSVVREEAAHLNQAADPSKAHLIEQLDDAKLANWANLSHEQKLSSIQAKLELEIDAQKQVIADLSKKPVLTDAEALQIDSAWQNIEHLRGQFEEWAALDKEVAAGATSESALLDQPSRLFNKPTTTEFDALDIAAKDEKDFVTQYRERNPSSRLTDDELIDRYKSGKRINPDSDLLHTPGRRAPRKPDVPAQFRAGHEERLSTVHGPPRKGWTPMELSTEAQAEREALIAQRDAARAERDALRAKVPPDETEAAKAGARVNEASRRIGELHANEYMARFHSDYDRIYPPPGAKSRSGDFDQVWRRFKIGKSGQKEYIDEVIIIESKGGAGKLGVREVDGKIVEQGTPAYYEAIRDNMLSIDRDTYAALNRAGRSRTRYLLVHSPIESGSPSSATDILVDEFDIGHAR